MRQTLSRGMVAAAAATSILSLCGGGYALADANAEGAANGSPGALSGNHVEAPLHVPLNVCGNSADVVAALNPAFGNACAEHAGAHGNRAHGTPNGHDDPHAG
ncbi:chaplin family protein, partial [Streptomyces sp. NPDC012616]|uniref:chaplin n=1 Tax=Streptomyces sp. NPDC012616 TaxID=3364840 RepID=UPI0036EDEFD9